MSQGPDSGSIEVAGYQIGRRIGRGGFAVVHEAVQLSLGRAVAVKILMPELASEKDLQRFARERMLLADLSRHRHVVDVIDAGTAGDGRPYIVMRLYRRGSLAQALADAGPMRPAEVVALVTKLAGALQAAHSLGVVHRDVKPENVLIADDGEPALADFGISMLTGPDRTTTGNFFTMGHAAPEVLERSEYGVASDVYALASTAYQLLTGRLAFAADSYYGQMRAIVQDPVPPVGRPDVPPALEAALLRGMAKRPEDRYPSAIALADALNVAIAPSGAGGSWPSGQPAAGYPHPSSYPVPPSYPQPTGYPQPPNYSPPGYPPAATTAAADQAPTDLLLPFEAGTDQPGSTGGMPPGSPGSGGRRGRRTAAFVLAAALLVGAGLVGGSYALGLPPGSLLFAAGTGGSAPPLVLATDFSLQQLPADGMDPTVAAIQLYLEQIGSTVGGHPLTLRQYDSATPARTRWDGSQCEKNAREHVRRTDEIAVIGPYNSGCAKVQVPILAKDPTGPMVMVSNGSTDPGLTKAWDKGEPDRYYPNGVRNFARVVTTDDVQGKAAAALAGHDLKITKVFVLDDGQVYGKHVARAFADAAQAAGITVVGTAQWDRAAIDYTDLFAKAKAAGAQAVFLGGAEANNGTQLIKDKVKVLGDNTAVKLLAADGFAGVPELAAMPEAQGLYVTFPAKSPARIRLEGGPGSTFLNAYQARYGSDPADPYALYGVAATQVVLEAIARSDGTRRGVHDAIFTGAGVTVPKAVSVLGADTRIDPATGDVSIKEVTVNRISRNTEAFETVIDVP